MSRISDAQRRRVRDQSRSIFGGAQYRVEVGAAIADSDGIVCIKDLAASLGDPPGTPSVNAELKVLEKAGLLDRAPRAKGERRVYLVRQPSAYWNFCKELRDAAVQRHRRSAASGVANSSTFNG